MLIKQQQKLDEAKTFKIQTKILPAQLLNDLLRVFADVSGKIDSIDAFQYHRVRFHGIVS